MHPPALQTTTLAETFPAGRRRIDAVLGPLERLCALPLALAALPVVAASAAAVALLSGRSPFVAHLRVGRQWSPLWMWKVRTMWERDERPASGGFRLVEFVSDENGPTRKKDGDPRVTHPFAAFCRRHSIDELPQLWHVLRGEMSLVGPRPLTRGEIEANYAGAADEILEVNPGITGLWQVSGRSRLTYAQRLEMDLRLVRHRSGKLYAKILAKTLAEVLTGRNAW